MRLLGLGWLALLLLGGCESRPATGQRSINEIVADTVVLRVDSVVAPVGAEALGALPRALTPPRPLPPDTNLLGARQAVLRQAALPADTSAPLIPRPSSLTRRAVRLLASQTGTRRYVGTLGGQAVVVELTGLEGARQDPAYFVGSYYFEWGGQAHSLSTPTGFRGNRPLFLVEKSDEEGTTGTWRAVQRLGPALTGIWTDKRTRRTARFTLHENYVGAVRYEVLDETIHSRDSCRWGSDGEDIYYRQGYVQWESLHLLGQDTLRQLRRLQCLPPGQRRRQMRFQLPDMVCNQGPPITFGQLRQVLVNYNGDGLLAITTIAGEDVGAAYPMDGPEEHLYDLTTGRACELAGWLRVEKMAAFRQLLTRYLLADETGVRHLPSSDMPGLDKEPYLMARLPALLLNSRGLAFRLVDVGAPHVSRLVPITVPYAALAPYVRPGTPLARLVAARARPRR